MLGHRALNVEDYLAILKRRWWIIAIPAIILPIVGLAITLVIPPKYVSQTLVLINQQKVPDDIVQPVVTGDLDSRLASMKEQILSRSSLQPIIQKYNLYASGSDMDLRIESVRRDIDIQPIRSEIARSNGLPGFKIFFTADDPHTAQQVCAEITSLFTSANLASRQAAAEGTTDFLKEQLEQAKHNLDDQDAKLAAFQRQYFGMLPEDESNNVNLLTTLNSRLDASTQQLQAMEQGQSMMESMLATQQAQSAATASGPSPVRSPQVQQTELDSLEAQKADLDSRYTSDYPAVKEVNRKIAELQAKMAQAETAPAPVAPSTAAPPTNRPESASIQQLRTQLRGVAMAIQAKRKEQDQVLEQIRSYQGRIQSSPQVAEQEKELTRDYQTSQTAYDHLLAQMNQAQMATDLEHRQEGETFSLLDASNLPESPTYPKPGLFAMVGLAGGLGLGLMIVALLEYRDTALRTERDVWAFTQLPTLAVIAWSGGMDQPRPGKLARFRRLFKRKGSKKLLVDAPG